MQSYVSMIFWCSKCEEYRKRGSKDWHRCERNDAHRMEPADRKLDDDMRKIRARVEKQGSPDAADLAVLRILEAVKNDTEERDTEQERMDDLADETLKRCAYVKHDPNLVFFWLQDGDSWDVLEAGDRRLEQKMSRMHQQRYGEPASGRRVRDSLASHCHRVRSEGTHVLQVFRRIAFDDGYLMIDLGGTPRRLHFVSEELNETEPYAPGSGVVFERHGAKMPEPECKGDGWLDKFCDLLGMPDNMRMLFCTHLCHLFCIHQETPVMLFAGPHGSGKTVAGTLVRELVDPVGMRNAAQAMPHDLVDLHRALHGSPVVLFDDISRIDRKASEALCAACSGGAIPAPFGYVRVILTSSDGRAIESPSLAGCTLRYDLESPTKWRPKDDVVDEFERMRPYLYNEIFDILRDVMDDIDKDVEDTFVPMADFEAAGRSIVRHMGHDEGEFVESFRASLGGGPSGAACRT